MLYEEWGFRGCPFETTSLPPTEFGSHLLVGRAEATTALRKRIASSNKLATVEGLNGVGKTSVVNVSSYQLLRQHVELGEGPLYIPCRKVFQLRPNTDIEEFIDYVFMEVAQTLIEESEEIKRKGHYLRSEAMNRWLNEPQAVAFSGGIWIVSGGRQESANTTDGFQRSGFRKAVIDWLNKIFPERRDGGVICIIDNLELLQSSDAAREKLEYLRDELFILNGLRWVLCGSLGIIHGVVTSPRLDGYLHDPVEIGEIGAEHCTQILTSRLAAYKLSDQYYMPLTERSFERLYSILNGNIRSVLGSADDFCHWIADHHVPDTAEEKDEAFQFWLNDQATRAYDATRQNIRPRAMRVFEQACERVVFSPSDFEEFGFNSVAAMRPHVKDLEDAGTLVSTQDEGDKRRKTIQVTPKGWLMSYHLRNTSTISNESDSPI
ncbi:helix-turn-helix domain-containing protein [Pelagerythrobacter aerophilus]|uniref:hypothetical protein n=1 Tax=Pelagerythrobacter aerophilus TaxID=2306995 RepID=UPI0011C4063A|nr:hypothetical protein [Pelagerythrobacter aerophilus]